MTSAVEDKELGDAFFRKGDHEDAIRLWSSSIEKAKGEESSTSDKDSLLKTLYSNRSAAYLKLHDYEKSVSDANICIEYDRVWAKGYYRKGLALRGMKRLTHAMEAYEVAHKLAPEDLSILNELDELKKLLQQSAGLGANEAGKKAPGKKASNLIRDGGDTCSNCGRTADITVILKKCSACGGPRYCDKVCQKNHWPLHKVQCKKSCDDTKNLMASGFDPIFLRYSKKWREQHQMPLTAIARLSIPVENAPSYAMVYYCNYDPADTTRSKISKIQVDKFEVISLETIRQRYDPSLHASMLQLASNGSMFSRNVYYHVLSMFFDLTGSAGAPMVKISYLAWEKELDAASMTLPQWLQMINKPPYDKIVGMNFDDFD